MGLLDSNSNKIEDTAKQLWGRDLHLNYPAPPHVFQLEEVFQQRWTDAMKGDLLEIGCGSGTDLKDRLMSPINHRFTKLEMEGLISSAGFDSFEVVKTSSGLYIYAVKDAALIDSP
jgi:hypothetical protein